MEAEIGDRYPEVDDNAPLTLGKTWRGLLRARVDLWIRTLVMNDYTGLFRPRKLRFLGT